MSVGKARNYNIQVFLTINSLENYYVTNNMVRLEIFTSEKVKDRKVVLQYIHSAILNFLFIYHIHTENRKNLYKM